MATTPTEMATSDAGPRYTLWQMVAYMLGLGTWGFGGPVALVGYMYRDLVEKRGWISEADYKEGMAIAQLMPGPLAAQLAIYLGFVHFWANDDAVKLARGLRAALDRTGVVRPGG
jgi:chromate transporter